MAEQLMDYGPSGTGKTTDCGQFHRYEAIKRYEQQQPYVGLHVTVDSSFEPLQDELAQGLCRVWHLGYETADKQASPLASLVHFAAGFIPVDLNPETGERLSNNWTRGTNVAVSIEGLWMIANTLKQYLMNDRNLLSAVRFTEVNGANVGSADVGIYDIIGNQLFSIVTRLKGAPYGRILWTSHDGMGEGLGKATVLGPGTLPNKNLDKVSGWFAHTIHKQVFEFTNEHGQTEQGRLLHFEGHKDANTGLIWPCKTSLSPRRTWELKQHALSVSGGQIGGALVARIKDGQMTGGIVDLLRFLDAKAS